MIKKAECLSKTDFTKFKELWNFKVRQSKEIMKSRQFMQMEIAENALEVCDISWGGHYSKYENSYTLTRFAKEIGVSNRTLGTWVAVKKRVYDKITKAEAKESSYQEMHDVAVSVPTNASKSKVREALAYRKGRGNVDAKMITYCRYMHTVINHLFKDEVLSDISPPVLNELLFCSETISQMIRKHDSTVKPIDEGLARKKAKKHMSAAEALGLKDSKTKMVRAADGTKHTRITKFDNDVYEGLKRPCMAKDVAKEMGLKDKSGRLRVFRSIKKLMEIGAVERYSKGIYASIELSKI